jgi:hypothetical protein
MHDVKGFRCFSADGDGTIVRYAYGVCNGQGTGLGEPRNLISLGSHDLLAELIAWEDEHGVIRTGPEWLAAYDIAEVQVLADYRGRGTVRHSCGSCAEAFLPTTGWS